MTSYAPAAQPTLHFIGVTTARSSIMKVFPAWAEHLGIDARISGIDFPLHAEPAAYREAVAFLKHDPLTRGALVTTHKIDLFHACRDQFDVIDPFATLMDETSCLSRRDGRFVCHAKDPITSGRALDGFLPPQHFARTGAEVFAIGAGGSTIAITWHLMQKRRGADVPARIVVSNRSPARLEAIRRVHAQFDSAVPVEYVLAPTPADNDAVMARLAPGSLVINATGLGKDAPGSPLTDAGRFPERGIVWDLNYRGELIFLDQARAQQAARGLQVEDGWTYFIHGWSEVIAEVFALEAARDPANIPALSAIAARVSGR
jgi:shikimate 5-dehydrogenase